jgi:anti-sigma factor RsiW
MSPLTTEEMLRYLYNEMSAEESKQFLSVIDANPAMKAQFIEMQEGLDVLKRLKYSPSHKSVDRIRKYAAMGGKSMQ